MFLIIQIILIIYIIKYIPKLRISFYEEKNIQKTINIISIITIDLFFIILITLIARK